MHGIIPKTLSVCPAKMGTWLSSKLGKVKGGEEAEWRSHTVAWYKFNSHFPDGH